MRCLIVESSPERRIHLANFLRDEGYVIDSTPPGEEALWYAMNHPYDIIVLDRLRPVENGSCILMKLRKTENTTPVLVLHRQDMFQSLGRAENSGADAFLPRPFHTRELVARIRSLIRRKYGKFSSTVMVSDLAIDLSRKSVVRGGVRVELTKREYSILEYLAYRCGQTVSRIEIWDHVYENDALGSSNTVDVYIGYLRKKLNAGGRANLIHTRRGFGYALSATGDAAATAFPG